MLEVDFVDRWMTTSTDGGPGEDGQGENHLAIALKSCPVCKTVIRKCNRYNKQIKVRVVIVFLFLLENQHQIGSKQDEYCKRMIFLEKTLYAQF